MPNVFVRQGRASSCAVPIAAAPLALTGDALATKHTCSGRTACFQLPLSSGVRALPLDQPSSLWHPRVSYKA